MRPDTCDSVHFGVNFVFAPVPLIDGKTTRQFQEELATGGIEFATSNRVDTGFQLIRPAPEPLEVRLMQVGPAVAQLLILAGFPNRTRDEFADDAESVCAAFQRVWPTPVQIVQRDCTIHQLYVSAGEHAFQYLWEQRLRQPGEQLDQFGRPVLGGGLRFVMPPAPDEAVPTGIEVKIESYLVDPRKLYLDVAYSWPQPLQTGTPMVPTEMLETTGNFLANEVVGFILGADQ